ncbi:hypothetical protein ATL41_0727 [Flavimobilis soli]|uniref:Uncharacterized protein n=1 Tax=Flavimobilis soli TaxID=442709 RepID=A0A2A9EB33_9MICO|nr:hypothetical protein [Flavimobilis soli]PFG36023.1 hypothetical protein ATL41_0727 [Flavimobilis soli]
MTDQTPPVPSSVLTAAGLVGGYAVARATGVRALGGVALAAAGVAAGRTWVRAGIPQTAALAATYVAAFGLSHPLAKKIGAWPSVLTVAAAAGAASHLLADRAVVRR